MVGILIAALVITGSDDWLWWTPPVSVDPADHFGYSRQQIAKMSLREWNETASHKSKHFHPDAFEIVYGDALRFQNRRIAAKQGKAVKAKMERVRHNAFRFGMACIAVEDTLAGGGTYSIHLPKALYVESEQMISSLLMQKKVLKLSQRKLELTRKVLQICATTTKKRNTLLFDRPVNLADLHRYAKIAINHLEALQKSVGQINPDLRTNVDQFVFSWGKEYLMIRKAAAGLDPTSP